MDSFASIEDIKVQATIRLANTPGNHCYLIPWSALFSLASWVQVGYLVGENTRARYILQAKLGWSDEEAFINNSVYVVTGMISIGIGCMFASRII